jgi:hypothetical protein
MIKNCQIIFPKGVYRTPPENAFMNGYFYFYCVVKCGNHALGIHERIKKSSRTQKQTQTHGPMKRKDVPPTTDGRNDVRPCESFSLEHVPMQ